MNIAFAGFRHSHIYGLYKSAQENPEVTITGCCEENEEARREAEKMTGITFTYDNYEEVLKDPSVEAVAIGDYFQKRGGMIIAALKAGKHVICDKPLCTSLEELDEIERLVAEKNLQLCCMLDLRYMAQVQKAKEMIESGELGEIYTASFTGQHALNFENRPKWYFEDGKQGGTINDIAIHGIDLVRYLTGKNLTKVNMAKTWNAYADKAPNFMDAAQFMIEMDNMSLISDVTYAAPVFKGLLPTYWNFYFWGTKGMMNFRLSENSIHWFTDHEEIIECEPIAIDYLNAFMQEIKGVATMMNTQFILESQRQVLEIQKAAE